MACETIPESEVPTAAEDMEIVGPQPSALAVSEEDAAVNGVNGDSKAKRVREEEGDGQEAENGVGADKKQKVDKSVEEERLEKLEEEEDGGEGEVLEQEREEKSGPVTVGPKTFESSKDMFDYFFKFLHHWGPNFDVNKYEHLVLLELIKKGYSDPSKKIGAGVKAFQIRYHPEYKSRCFFVVRTDDTVDDFSFRKCVDHILPLPENMKAKSVGGDRPVGRGGRGNGGSGRGRGRGGRGNRR